MALPNCGILPQDNGTPAVLNISMKSECCAIACKAGSNIEQGTNDGVLIRTITYGGWMKDIADCQEGDELGGKQAGDNDGKTGGKVTNGTTGCATVSSSPTVPATSSSSGQRGAIGGADGDPPDDEKQGKAPKPEHYKEGVPEAGEVEDDSEVIDISTPSHDEHSDENITGATGGQELDLFNREQIQADGADPQPSDVQQDIGGIHELTTSLQQYVTEQQRKDREQQQGIDMLDRRSGLSALLNQNQPEPAAGGAVNAADTDIDGSDEFTTIWDEMLSQLGPRIFQLEHLNEELRRENAVLRQGNQNQLEPAAAGGAVNAADTDIDGSDEFTTIWDEMLSQLGPRIFQLNDEMSGSNSPIELFCADDEGGQSITRGPPTAPVVTEEIVDVSNEGSVDDVDEGNADDGIVEADSPTRIGNRGDEDVDDEIVDVSNELSGDVADVGKHQQHQNQGDEDVDIDEGVDFGNGEGGEGVEVDNGGDVGE